MAVRFDPRRMTTSGQPVAVIDNVRQAINMPNTTFESGAGQVSLSESGDLALATGGVYETDTYSLVQVWPDGRVVPLGASLPSLLAPRQSPADDRIAFLARTSLRSRQQAVFIFDRHRGVTTRLQAAGYAIPWPVWSPDGRSIAFARDSNGVGQVHQMPSDGSGTPQPIAPSTRGQAAASWSSTGVIAWLEDGDIWTITPPEAARRFVASTAAERYPSFSPDGRWLAYTSDLSGRPELYVRPYPAGEPAIQVSTGGASNPAWSPDGRALYFLSTRGEGLLSLLVVDVAPGSPFRVGRVRVVMPNWRYGNAIPVSGFQVLRDGSFLGSIVDSITGPRRRHRVTEIKVILNFHSELAARVRE